MSHIWMSHVTHMNESCHTYEWVMSRRHAIHLRHLVLRLDTRWRMSHVTHMNESCHTYEWVMSRRHAMHLRHLVLRLDTSWRKCIAWLIFIGHFPQKSPIINGSVLEIDLQFKVSYASSPPCNIAPTGVSMCVCVCVCVFVWRGDTLKYNNDTKNPPDLMTLTLHQREWARECVCVCVCVRR